MNKRLDPTLSVKDYSHLSQSQSGVIDTGDRAKTYVFDEDGPGSFKIIGKTNRPEFDTSSVLKRIAKTNDGRENWGEANNGDGESRNKLDLFDSEGNVADDFVALVKEAMEGDEGITLGGLSRASGDYVLEIEVQGRWSSDILKFSGDYVAQAMQQLAQEDPSGYAATFGSAGPTHVDLFDKSEQVGVFVFDRPDKNDSVYHGRNNFSTEDMSDLLDGGSFMNDGEMIAVVNAALNQKYGIAELDGLTYFNDDGSSISIGITNTRGATDTIVLTGSEVEAVIGGFADQFTTNMDTGDGRSKFAFWDTDEGGSMWWGGGKNIVHFDEDETVSLGNTSGNQLNTGEIDEFVFLALSNDGAKDVDVVLGGQEGDDFIKVELATKGGNTDTLVLTGDLVEQAIESYWDFVA
ncbi:hypothetical protein BXY66_0814 [Shimia isoporae]|uniref:Uncharacterized protein n=1 Tax=Shimia isoporae TaxID=647720 RepID=A0A4R1NKZ9_9RHOB|nr:hypothetical protein [Shimia isoporae]TCL08775.1 hypothetical protein BXY66_0814 [Shimia isoporae]